MRSGLMGVAAVLAVALAVPAPLMAEQGTGIAPSERRLLTEKEIADADLPIPQDALDRRERSQQRLVAEGVPINPYLPAIEGEGEASIRSKADVVNRAMALTIVAVRAQGMDVEDARALVGKYDLADHLTPVEAAYLADDEPEVADHVQMVWRYEAAAMLLWAVGLADELGFTDAPGKPTGIIDAPTLTEIMAKRTAEQMHADARLRPAAELLDAADMIYRYHWAAREAGLNGEPIPAGLDMDVIMERHHALNWLIGYLGQDWDDVSTDT